MFATLRPLFPYLRRYRRDFMWGGLAAVLANVIWIFFPQVIRVAIDDLNHGVTRQKIFFYAGLLVAISAAKGVFLFLTRWIIIGISGRLSSTCATTCSATWSGNRRLTSTSIAPATLWPG
jgi:ATP-binding cassette, subfamily B, multidrug efflux pump